MTGDFSRDTFRPNKRYSRVQHQQGRVNTDADFNEQAAIEQHRTETGTADLIGRTITPPRPGYSTSAGAPNDNAGFGLTVDQNGELVIGAGHYYIDGKLAQNDASLNFSDQLSATDIHTLLGDNNAALGMAYLDVWERPISSLDDPEIREKALGGADTTTRLQTTWQVRVEPLPSVTMTAAEQTQLANLLDQLAQAQPGPQRDQLLDDIRALQDSLSARCMTDFPELRDVIRKTGTGRMTARTLDTNTQGELCLLPDTGGYQRLENQLYRVEIHSGGTRSQARFKWSRENASVVTKITNFSGAEITVEDLGRDANLGFSNNNWVEIINDETELNGTSGEMVRINSINVESKVITLNGAPSSVSTNLALNPKLRRWDHGGNTALGRQLTGPDIPIEGGIVVEFESGLYRTGDYWLIPARTEPVGDIEWSPAGAHIPDGTQHYRARLGLLFSRRVQAVDTLYLLEDCRKLFPPLTNITADDVSFDDDNCDFEADTVQEAIEALCARNSDGSCTITITEGVANIQAVLDTINDEQDATICFGIGTFNLSDTLLLAGKGNLLVTGSGKGTRLVVTGLESALRFSDCRSVTIRDLHAETIATEYGNQLRGTIEFLNCGRVTVEDVSARCGHGVARTASCLRVINNSTQATFDAGTVRIRHCDLRIGHLQTGILLVNTPRAEVEDNLLQAQPKPQTFRLPDLIAAGEVAYLHPIARLLVNGIEVSPTSPTTGGTTSGGGVIFEGSRSGEIAGDITAGFGTARGGSNIERILRDSEVLRGFAVTDTTDAVMAVFMSPVENADEHTISFDRGGNSINFISTDSRITNETWMSTLELLNPSDRVFEDNATTSEFLFDTAMDIVLNSGMVANQPLYLDWFNQAVADDTSSAGQGIVVAGQVAEDVRILNNTVHTAIQGIHVGLSRRESFRGTPLEAQTVVIANNHIHISLPTSAGRERHAIFVGNVDSAVIENNFMSLRKYDTTNSLWIDAIRAWGHFGKRLIIRQNHSEGYTVGMFVRPLNNISQPQWLVSDNVGSVVLSGANGGKVHAERNFV